MDDPRRAIPSVDHLLASASFQELLEAHPRTEVTRHLREVLAGVRAALADSGEEPGSMEPERYASRVRERLAFDRPSLVPVINATGVVLHTNLGRAPLAEAARDAMFAAAQGYSNLEYDLSNGRRGSRYDHCVDLLKEITGAEDALVVNNAAAALVLAVSTFATGRHVAVSRGELIEIGGGFRIPDMLSRAGASLFEIGTTNRTRLGDYSRAIDTVAGDVGVGLLLKVHRSNFRISGFTEEASLPELVELGQERGVPVLYDLGSGLLIAPERLGLPYEPTVQRSVEAGASLVAFSGDKLLGGPQAGVLVGKAELLTRVRKNSLCRTFRVDKVTLAGLEATLRLYRSPQIVVEAIPTLRMISSTEAEIAERTEVVAEELRSSGIVLEVTQGQSMIGGGTYPEVGLPTVLLALSAEDRTSAEVAMVLRTDGDPPVVARVIEDRVVLDLRTVAPEEEGELLRRLREVLGR